MINRTANPIHEDTRRLKLCALSAVYQFRLAILSLANGESLRRNTIMNDSHLGDNQGGIGLERIPIIQSVYGRLGALTWQASMFNFVTVPSAVSG